MPKLYHNSPNLALFLCICAKWWGHKNERNFSFTIIKPTWEAPYHSVEVILIFELTVGLSGGCHEMREDIRINKMLDTSDSFPKLRPFIDSSHERSYAAKIFRELQINQWHAISAGNEREPTKSSNPSNTKFRDKNSWTLNGMGS